ncbi:hypothetical protein [Microvirga sp. TS319]|uniref:hypothetical protein n=1 Tax=Microvirga sp. TS319 TaxID=3241165 RepID=UPI003519F415
MIKEDADRRKPSPYTITDELIGLDRHDGLLGNILSCRHVNTPSAIALCATTINKPERSPWG